MKGLFLKDMLTYRKTNKLTGMLGTIALLIFFLVMKSEICFYIANFIILPVNAATQPSLLSFYDEQWKWKPYMIATPVSAQDIVLSRMLSALAILLLQSICIEAYNLAFFLLNPTFDRELFMLVLLAAIILGASCVLAYIVIDFAMKNSRELALGIQFALLFAGAGGVYAIGKMQFDVVAALLSIGLASILCALLAVLLCVGAATYFICVPAVKNAK